MGFSIDYGSGLLQALGLVFFISAAAIVVVWLFVAVRRARADAIDHDPDRHGPIL